MRLKRFSASRDWRESSPKHSPGHRSLIESILWAGGWLTSRQQILKILRKKSDFSLGFFDSRQARPEPQFESLLSQISEFLAFQRRLLKEI
jgi:hypothetical protein